MKFIDLFAGLGGFHLALHQLGHECVFASEINEELRNLYESNHGMECKGDINQIDIMEIPAHDIICAGFPCQPFSKAGKQEGLQDKVNGNFFNKIMEIVDFHKPKYLLLENVPNLKGHDNGNTWQHIEKELRSRQYDVKDHNTSPHKFGIPQHRTRMYIVCREGENALNYFKFPEEKISASLSIKTIIEENPKDVVPIKKDSRNQLDVWQKFLKKLESAEVPGFPIWAMEFGATYDYNTPPIRQTVQELIKKKGKLGQPITGTTITEALKCLPTYARTNQDDFPDWKKYYISANRRFYDKHKSWLDGWIPEISAFENSHQKFEWNCGKKIKLDINDKIVQFRPSGIRVKKPDFSPALVLSSTQIPVFPWLDRYMTAREAGRLQGMENLKEIPV